MFDLLESGGGNDLFDQLLLRSQKEMDTEVKKVQDDTRTQVQAEQAEQTKNDFFSTLEVEDKPGQNILTDFINGKIGANAPRRVETFEEFISKRNPAADFLTSIAQGQLARLHGKQGKSHREKLFEEFQVEQRGQIAQQQMEQQNVTNAIQAAVAMRNLNVRELGANERQAQRLEHEATSEQARLNIMGERLGLEEDRIEIAREGLQLSKDRFGEEKRENRNKSLPIHSVELARQALLPKLLEQAEATGLDPESGEFQLSAMNSYIEYAANAEKKLTAGRRQPAGTAALKPKFERVKDGFGRDMFIMRYADGRVLKSTMDPDKPLEPLREGQSGFSAKRVGELQAQRDAARMMNQALETFYSNPNVIGFGTTLQRSLPSDFVQNTIELVKGTGLADSGPVASAIDKLQTQRSFAAQLDVLTALQTRAFTGAQMTDKERSFIKRTLPSGASPEELVSLLSSRGAILKMVEIRERLGIRVGKDKADVSFQSVMADMDATATAYGKASTKKLKDLTAEQVREFLPGNEHLVSRNPDAMLLEINPLRFPVDAMFEEAARQSGNPQFIEEIERLRESGEL